MAHGDMGCMGSTRENFVSDGATAAGFLGEPRHELMLVGGQGEMEWWVRKQDAGNETGWLVMGKVGSEACEGQTQKSGLHAGGNGAPSKAC